MILQRGDMMQVSVESLEGLKRKLTVTLPSEQVEKEVGARLKKLAHTAKINGFRPGKAPMSEIVKRYSDSVRLEVARELVQSSLPTAFSEQDMLPAGYPQIDLLECEANQDLKYVASFEVFPVFEVADLDNESVEIVKSEVTAADIDKMIQNLRKQNQNWINVERAVKEGDRVSIDFEGFIDGEAFEGGKAERYQLVVGSKSMIPGFEEGIIGAEISKPTEITVTFPADYNHEPLAGKNAMFKIMVNAIEEGQLPELDDAFAEQFGIDEGIDALKKDISENMTRMLERQLSSMNRDVVFSKLLEKNKIELPASLVDEEIHELKHEMFHRIFGPRHSENEKMPDFPREMFEEQAKRRVQLGLVFSAYVKKHQLTVDNDRIDAMIEKMAGAYDNPDELRDHYRKNERQMEQLKSLALEELVAEKLMSSMALTEKVMDYESVINPSKGDDVEGE